ncbi:hypothetical protein [Paenibacillus puerhi]|uniref:hypothetical protein n=1 Tax=Paenibacillus puerhi TaxID=2692622 RepID=UPI00135991C8|nr:hypothetical protein [Paenibacillus puerhi]
MVKARIEIRDSGGEILAFVDKDDVLGTSFTVTDGEGSVLLRFYNGGLPSRNPDLFSAGDDLIKWTDSLQSQELLYRQLIAIPAFIKIMFGK